MKNNELKANSFIFSIRKNGEVLGYIETDNDCNLITSGEIGENTYPDFIELIKGLQGFDIHIDNFYW